MLCLVGGVEKAAGHGYVEVLNFVEVNQDMPSNEVALAYSILALC